MAIHKCEEMEGAEVVTIVSGSLRLRPLRAGHSSCCEGSWAAARVCPRPNTLHHVGTSDQTATDCYLSRMGSALTDIGNGVRSQRNLTRRRDASEGTRTKWEVYEGKMRVWPLSYVSRFD